VACIDLNADLGEGAAFDAELLRIVSSANIACGAHAGDVESMALAVRDAISNGVAVGAHPGYPDREGALADIAAELGARLTHIKPHGALYNDAVRNRDLADIIARVIAEAPGEPAFMGMAGTELERAADQHRLTFIAEAFVDRAYEPDGTLVSRKDPGAVHEDLAVVTTQAVRLAKDGETTARNGETVKVRADTLCIHGDTPGAAEKARAVRDVLESHGVDIRAHTLR
jgi:UPF0271 protein